MNTTNKRTQVKPADWIAIVALLVSIISLSITSYLSYYSIQTQKAIANLQATAQTQNAQLLQENGFAHLEVKNFGSLVDIINKGPAPATNIRVIIGIGAINKHWKSYINNLNDFSLTFDPAAVVDAISEINTSIGHYQTLAGKSAFEVLLKSIAPHDVITGYFELSELVSTELHSYHSSAILYSPSQKTNTPQDDAKNYTQYKFNIAFFDISLSCTNCYVTYATAPPPYYAEVPVPLTSVRDISSSSATIALGPRSNNLYQWNFHVDISYVMPKGTEPLPIPSPLYLREDAEITWECKTATCAELNFSE